MAINSKIQEIYDDEKHAGDIDLTCDVASWDGIYSSDWESKIPHTTVDVLMGVEVGLCRHNGARKLLIRFVDTRVEYVNPSSCSFGGKDQPSVFAYAFRVSEILEIEKHIKSVDDTLIHREPWVDDKSRIAQARWMIVDGRITGVAVAVRATQELVPTIHCISFLTKGHYFRKLQVDDQSPRLVDELSKVYLKAVESNPLPIGVLREGPELKLPKEYPQPPIRPDYTSEGDSVLELEIEGVGGTTSMNQSYRDPTAVVQHLMSDKITIRNPTKSKHYIRSISTFVKVGKDGDFVECLKDHTYLGLEYDYTMMYGKKQANPQWEENTSFEIQANSQKEFFVKGVWKIPNSIALSTQPFNRRLHKSFEQPVTTKAVFTDDQGSTKAICWDTVNDPLPERLNSYEDLCANEAEMKRLNNRGIGPDFDCIMWLHADDPQTLLRTYVIVTHAKTSPTCWYIRVETSNGAVPTNYTQVSPSQFHRIVYDATEKEIDVTKKWARSNKICTLTLLLDLEQNVIFGLKASIKIDTSTLEQAVYLDQTVVEAEPPK